MFSKSIVDSDAFMDMPQSSQLLYFHLCMRADDEGFVGNPKRIIRMVGSNDDDYKILFAKSFIIPFESGVCVIKHWLIHNTIRMDRFNPTTYQDEKCLLNTKENKAYTLGKPNGNQMATQVKLSKVNIREDKIEASLNFLKEIPEDKLEEMYQKFDCDKKAIKSKAEDLYNYCQAKGKVYKNYHAFLLNALKKDFKERKEPLQIKKIVMIDGRPTYV